MRRILVMPILIIALMIIACNFSYSQVDNTKEVCPDSMVVKFPLSKIREDISKYSYFENDTITWSDRCMIITMPSVMIKYSVSYNYLEGIIITYLFFDVNQKELIGKHEISIKAGTMIDIGNFNPENDSIIFERQFNEGPLTRSLKFKRGKNYFRIDSYKSQIEAFYKEIPESKISFADSILDQVKCEFRTDQKRTIPRKKGIKNFIFSDIE